MFRCAEFIVYDGVDFNNVLGSRQKISQYSTVLIRTESKYDFILWRLSNGIVRYLFRIGQVCIFYSL